jgi:hypothetical protein
MTPEEAESEIYKFIAQHKDAEPFLAYCAPLSSMSDAEREERMSDLPNEFASLFEVVGPNVDGIVRRQVSVCLAKMLRTKMGITNFVGEA